MSWKIQIYRFRSEYFIYVSFFFRNLQFIGLYEVSL